MFLPFIVLLGLRNVLVSLIPGLIRGVGHPGWYSALQAIEAGATILAVFLGLAWEVAGVAVGLCLKSWLLVPLYFWLATRSTELGRLSRVVVRVSVTALAGAAAAAGLSAVLLSQQLPGPVVLVSGSVLSLGIYIVMIRKWEPLTWRSASSTVMTLIESLIPLFRRGSS